MSDYCDSSNRPSRIPSTTAIIVVAVPPEFREIEYDEPVPSREDSRKVQQS